MKDRKELKKIAKEIIKLEHKCQQDKNNTNKYMTEMQQLISNLSIEEILALDEYIARSSKLKK